MGSLVLEPEVEPSVSLVGRRGQVMITLVRAEGVPPALLAAVAQDIVYLGAGR